MSQSTEDLRSEKNILGDQPLAVHELGQMLHNKLESNPEDVQSHETELIRRSSGIFSGIISRFLGSGKFPRLWFAISHCLELPSSVLVSSFFLNFLGLALPLVILQVYDRILPNKSVDTLALLMFGLAGVIIIDGAMKMARSFVMGWSAIQSSYRQELEAVRKFLYARSTVIDDHTPSQWMDRLDALSDINRFKGGTAPLILLDLPFVVIFLAVIFLVGGVLVGVPILLILGFGFLAIKKGAKLQSLLQERSELDSRRYDFIAECLYGIQTIKSMSMEPLMQRRFERLQQSSANVGFQTMLHGSSMQTFGNLFANVSMILIVSIGAVGVMNDAFSIGALACCTLLSGRIISPVLRGIGIWTDLQNIVIAHERVAPLLSLPSPDESTNISRDTCLGAITIQNLSYSDEDGSIPSLDNISLKISPGDFVGIKGRDSCGTSTLLKAIRGEIVPDQGSVHIDGHNILGPAYQGLVSSICYVPARAMLFRGTILENITMFRTGTSIESAREAAMLIGLEEDIHRLPDGYDTMVGDGIADKLPMGLMQRIAIARAIARRPNILILNQANATLDLNADRKFGEGLAAIKGSLTMVMVSNRPSILKNTDRIYEMKDGSILAQNEDSASKDGEHAGMRQKDRFSA